MSKQAERLQRGDLSRLDIFAAAAMEGIIAASTDSTVWPDPDVVAEQAVKYAKALDTEIGWEVDKLNACSEDPSTD